jgi:hypothetical protein
MKKFLTSFAAVAAGFAANNASALPLSPDVDALSAAAPHAPTIEGLVPDEKLAVVGNEGNLFNFTMKRSSETGHLMAYHESHASHASHASHYSSRN